MRYNFQLVNQFVRISNADTTQVLHITPVNTITLRKLNEATFSFNIAGEGISILVNWQETDLPNHTLYGNIDLFLVDLAALMNAPIIGGGGGASVDSADIIGGSHQVGTVAARDAIATGKRYFGMLVTVNADGTQSNNTTYMLANAALGGVNDTITDNNNWIRYQTVGVGNKLFMYYNFT